MKDNLSVVITVIVLVMLMVIFPLYNYFERQDDMSYNIVLKSTTNFVDEVINCGYIDQQMYDNFIQKLSITGNLYDIQLEAHKRTYTKDPYNMRLDTFIEQYNIDYNNDIGAYLVSSKDMQNYNSFGFRLTEFGPENSKEIDKSIKKIYISKSSYIFLVIFIIMSIILVVI